MIKYKVDAFVLQLLLWSDQYEVPYDRGAMDAKLKKLGNFITAVEVYGLMRIHDYFEAQSHVSGFVMVGLSYGGFYTLFTAAVDTRIKSVISCSYFNTGGCIPHSDLTWFCASEQFDAEIFCFVYPCKLCIEIGEHDSLFDYKCGLKMFDKLTEMCKEVGDEWLSLVSFDGDHEFCNDDLPIERMIKDISC